MKTVAIIQARMKSTRLPGKVLLPLAGKPALIHMVERIGHCQLVDEILIATTRDSTDDPIAGLRIRQKVPVWIFRGHPTDVMGRVIEGARIAGAGTIIQLTADCPMIDPRHIDYLVNMSRRVNSYCDIVTNVHPRTWPDGLDILIYSKEALWKVDKMVTDAVLRSHAGWNILQFPSMFDHWNWAAPDLDLHWPELGLTLDEPIDQAFLSILFGIFYNPEEPFRVEKVIRWLREDPKRVLNAEVRRKTPEEG